MNTPKFTNSGNSSGLNVAQACHFSQRIFQLMVRRGSSNKKSCKNFTTSSTRRAILPPAVHALFCCSSASTMTRYFEIPAVRQWLLNWFGIFCDPTCIEQNLLPLTHDHKKELPNLTEFWWRKACTSIWWTIRRHHHGQRRRRTTWRWIFCRSLHDSCTEESYL